jgi:GIY-YIG catalytic domain
VKTHKEMKQEYKLYKSQKGVYQIKNKTNGKILIGSSADLKAIWNRQRTQLNFGNHPNKELQKEWNDYGEEAFEYEIISEIKEKEDEEKDYRNEILDLEKLFIEEMQPFGDKGYNKK